MNTILKKHTIAMLMLISMMACTKKETIPYEREQEKIIESFSIVNTAKLLKGLVNQHEKTITIIIPEGEYYTALEPEIKLAKGYKLKVGADSVIVDLMDYFANGRDINYPIIDKNGVTSTFKLVIKTLQAPLILEEVSPTDKQILAVDMAIDDFRTQALKLLANPTNYSFAKNFETNQDISKSYLVNKEGKEFIIENLSLHIPLELYANPVFNLNLKNVKGHTVITPNKPTQYTNEPPTGLYWIKLQYYSRIYQLKNPIRIYYSK